MLFRSRQHGGEGRRRKELPSTVTVLVRPEQSRLLARLEAEGEIHLSLVFRGESGKAAEFIEAQDQMLDEMQEETAGEDSDGGETDGEDAGTGKAAETSVSENTLQEAEISTDQDQKEDMETADGEE